MSVCHRLESGVVGQGYVGVRGYLENEAGDVVADTLRVRDLCVNISVVHDVEVTHLVRRRGTVNTKQQCTPDLRVDKEGTSTRIYFGEDRVYNILYLN